MNSVDKPLIHTIRRFNRFYTNILGLLDRHMPDSDFSLAEVRVLYEIGHRKNCTAMDLIETLRIDPGYLSRIIKRFRKETLLYRVQSPEDGRLYYLNLTDIGKDTLRKLDSLSNGQIQRLINSVPERDRMNVAESMKTIENALTAKPIFSGEEVKIRCELRPGDVGDLIRLHGRIYAEECGHNHAFEGYVCKTFYNLFQNYSPEKDRFWFAELNSKMMGAIAIVEHSAKLVQLRWFILHPSVRRLGLGKTLLNEAINYCKERGYQKVFLETTKDRETAIKMYTKAGFRKVTEHDVKMWGKELVEQTYELNLT
ncbi:bifunctional helix-turn-helix transcriptional regulator/GNAT family N-acetyltransferase [Desulfosporosinus sp. BICA1-9]|uniref:bifunctional helix-turn-helix transcriptional regulator/GNAT family N-acetyltransferase n=1 Tax=Desulfosporosinus sp. BICA1-9 TaxID=1531958 RepID=UPI00054BDB45|nr:bifunctional helix-turn-helix transcriptional regulator/GNAT family N-acetyltransferase [Desulfosporosinus sp. BICA1-9]KJS48414.1 MAG: MarR family transcriptional regulator [Peptococcaceae bacterium BRH_c23]KJS89425.1 MAG: MarR family transcriptional regulator [Desulfosporosinus sp. BICA1-9]HBW36708.1 GNAT family N-acetyltransferase [Desulfosporosinus sp.]